MIRTQVRNAVISIIQEIAPDSDTSSLDDTLSLREQVDLDSMDFLDLVMELRKRHQVEVPKEDFACLKTMESCVTYLLPKFGQKAA
ncbi:MAG TPA: acyl carrier protein [Bacteriovoracaceae bacterium]|nr:acyl carrier protein [Bacteriovoracaceae bacterium]